MSGGGTEALHPEQRTASTAIAVEPIEDLIKDSLRALEAEPLAHRLRKLHVINVAAPHQIASGGRAGVLVKHADQVGDVCAALSKQRL